MESFQECMQEYKKQLEKGYINGAYKGLMKYIMGLRAHFKNKYPQYVSSSIYYGYMDMTYFSLFPESLKRQKLKIAVVFIHDTFKFEVWLAGTNKNIQNKYWKLFKEREFDKYHIPSTIKGIDSIIEHNIVDNPNFSDLNALTRQIEIGTIEFINNVETFLSTSNPS
ncbi:hypothetical protein [Methanobacterium sp.]|jgi:hypothetical protein|uniref:DUF7000 family protein n=1 Tax=Methanobacterium sp. TaxID=2164 RepID=UPI003158970E